jgi:nucleotide-binding universal stress UspA family protein
MNISTTIKNSQSIRGKQMKPQINKIMACVDFSPYSYIVLDYAFDFLKMTKAQLLVFNVVNVRDITGVKKFFDHYPGAYSGASSIMINTDDYIKALKKEREANIQDMIRKYTGEHQPLMEITIAAGIPYECILEAIETEGIDLVFMANKGRGNISRMLSGSAAEKVFRQSPVPVISVRDRDEFKRE